MSSKPPTKSPPLIHGEDMPKPTITEKAESVWDGIERTYDTEKLAETKGSKLSAAAIDAGLATAKTFGAKATKDSWPEGTEYTVICPKCRHNITQSVHRDILQDSMTDESSGYYSISRCSNVLCEVQLRTVVQVVPKEHQLKELRRKWSTGRALIKPRNLVKQTGRFRKKRKEKE